MSLGGVGGWHRLRGVDSGDAFWVLLLPHNVQLLPARFFFFLLLVPLSSLWSNNVRASQAESSLFAVEAECREGCRQCERLPEHCPKDSRPFPTITAGDGWSSCLTTPRDPAPAGLTPPCDDLAQPPA